MDDDRTIRFVVSSFVASFLALTGFVLLSLWNSRFPEELMPIVAELPLIILMTAGPPVAVTCAIMSMVRIARATGEKKGWTLAVVSLFLGIMSLHITLVVFTYKTFQ